MSSGVSIVARRRPLAVAHVLLSLEPGGLENGVVNVVNRLDPARFRSQVCCLKRAGEFAQRLRGPVEVHPLGWRGGNDPLLPLRLARLFHRIRPDIVHTRNAEAFFYGFLAAKIAGVRAVVHSEHGRTFDDRPLRFWAQRVFSRSTDAIFAVSEQLKRDLVTHVGIPAPRIDVLYNGVDLGRFDASQRDQVRAELGIPDGELIVGSVGRLVPVKNYPLLLRALHRLGANNVTLLLVGEGAERGALQEAARGLGMGARLRLLGHSETVPRLLSAMDVFVLPSVSEGMSNTLLEAMSCGVAVVASNVGGNPEIIKDGQSGLLFESCDEAALCELLRTLMADAALRRRLGAAGRQRVLEDFTMEAMISRYERLYHAIGGASDATGGTQQG